jgi:hypothetical protein
MRTIGFRMHGSSILFPGLEDVVMAIGGANYDEALCGTVMDATDSTQYIVAGAPMPPSPLWTSAGCCPCAEGEGTRCSSRMSQFFT